MRSQRRLQGGALHRNGYVPHHLMGDVFVSLSVDLTRCCEPHPPRDPTTIPSMEGSDRLTCPVTNRRTSGVRGSIVMPAPATCQR